MRPIGLLLAAALVSLPSCTQGGAGGAGNEPAVEAVLGRQGRGPGRFLHPRALAWNERSGELCVADKTGRIQRFALAALAAAGPAGAAQPLNSWTLPQYEVGQPTRIHTTPEGRLLVADTHYQRVRLYDPTSGAELLAFGEAGEGEGQFSQIRDVVLDRAGNYYAADYGAGADRIQKFDRAGRFLIMFGRRGSGPGELQRVQELALELGADADDGAKDTLLVADCCNHRLQRFALDGRHLESWGREGDGPGEFRYPYGLAVEPRPAGDIFVVEWGNNRVQRFDHRGRPLGVWGRAGRGPGELATPWDVELLGDGRLWVADCNNHRVQLWRLPPPPPATAMASPPLRGPEGTR